MKHILVGTFIPGTVAEKWIPVMKDKGFECFAVTFHMSYGDVDIRTLGPKVRDMLEGSGTLISTLGYYCNPLENEEQLHILEKFIDLGQFFVTLQPKLY